jgi:hypothetical protein
MSWTVIQHRLRESTRSADVIRFIERVTEQKDSRREISGDIQYELSGTRRVCAD